MPYIYEQQSRLKIYDERSISLSTGRLQVIPTLYFARAVEKISQKLARSKKARTS